MVAFELTVSSIAIHGCNALKTKMGLGKTLQSISVLVYMHEYRNVGGPHLIVVPKSTLSNWMKEIQRWAPSLTAVQFHGNKVDRERIISEDLEPAQRDEDRKWNIVVTTYEVCNIEKNVLTKFAWSYLIIGKLPFVLHIPTLSSLFIHIFVITR